MYTFSGDETAPFFDFLDVDVVLVFSCMGATYGTAKNGVGVASMGVMRSKLIMKLIIPIVMAKVLGIYGLIIAIIISTDGAHRIPHIFLGDYLLGGGNGCRSISFVGGNEGSKSFTGTSRINSSGGLSNYNSMLTSNFDGKGTWLIFNLGDTIYINDFNSQDKDPIKAIHFSNSNPVCHAFDAKAKDGHDLLIGLNSRNVYPVSLRHQLQDFGKKLVGAQHYNKYGSVSTNYCTSIALIPQGYGVFVVAHSIGNLSMYEKAKDGTGSLLLHIHGPIRSFELLAAASGKILSKEAHPRAYERKIRGDFGKGAS